ncbi:uncharacterized protein E0L32_005300 [Thyridium curvatum]|uniref:Heterokaryon incompatibility domain-containing protein n=1 Tax=Thyridium curvatum TaxID=1093900 RepID=A0A507BCX1_9PEZI|nr:uncharacterized protein E0L32_005300 [Thyridium curvatum]TPX14608.1 hypothetical protein E0L32_005300 [Thyridium curvatum]
MPSAAYVAVTPASEADGEEGGAPVSLPPPWDVTRPPSSASRSSLPSIEDSLSDGFDAFNTPANRTFYLRSPYKSLDPNKNEIRLLRFSKPLVPPQTSQKNDSSWQGSRWSGVGSSSAASNSLISCEILDKRMLPWVQGQYIALSYCAGSAKSTKIVTVNGQPFNVFANLAHAIECVLRCWSARKTGLDGDLVLWADQICINQADKEERASQVSMMQDIYRNSASVYVCLSTPDLPRSVSHKGAGDSGGWMLWTSVLTLPHKPADPQRGTERFRSPIFHTTSNPPTASADQMCSTLRHQLINERAANEWISSLEQFLSAPWWKRAWVYQEFVMAPQVQFLHHSTSIPWDELSPLLEFVCYELQDRLDDWRLSDHHHQHPKEERTSKRASEKRARSSGSGRTVSVHERQLKQHRDDKQRLERELEAANLDRPSYLDRAVARIKTQRLKKKIEALALEIRRLEGGPQELLQVRGGHTMQQRRPKDLAVAESTEITAARLLLRERLTALTSARRTVLSIARARRQRPTALTDLLLHARNCLSSDPRDRVYAFLGLAEGEYAVTPCYDKANTVERVLVDTARAIVAHDHNLDMLGYVGCRSGPVVFDGDGIPTWVPDWTAPEDSAGLEFHDCVRRLRDRDRAAGPFCAAGGTRHVIAPRPTAGAGGVAAQPPAGGPHDVSNMHLPVKGVLLGKLGNAVMRSGNGPSHAPRTSLESRNGGDSLPLPMLLIQDSATKLRAVVPKTTGYDDEIWVLQGAKHPVVLRPQKNGKQYFSFLGESVVLTDAERFADVMFGQAMKEASDHRATLRDIYLV